MVFSSRLENPDATCSLCCSVINKSAVTYSTLVQYFEFTKALHSFILPYNFRSTCTGQVTVNIIGPGEYTKKVSHFTQYTCILIVALVDVDGL